MKQQQQRGERESRDRERAVAGPAVGVDRRAQGDGQAAKDHTRTEWRQWMASAEHGPKYPADDRHESDEERDLPGHG